MSEADSFESSCDKSAFCFIRDEVRPALALVAKGPIAEGGRTAPAPILKGIAHSQPSLLGVLIAKVFRSIESIADRCPPTSSGAVKQGAVGGDVEDTPPMQLRHRVQRGAYIASEARVIEEDQITSLFFAKKFIISSKLGRSTSFFHAENPASSKIRTTSQRARHTVVGKPSFATPGPKPR